MTTRLTRMALATMIAMTAHGGIAHAQGRRGGMVGNRGGGGGGGSGYRGSPSFSSPAARPANRPTSNAGNRPDVNPGNAARPGGGGMNRPNPGGNAGGRPTPGGNQGARPNPGGDPGYRPGQGANPGNRPGTGGNSGNRPGQGGIGDRPPFGGIGGNRPGPGGNTGDRPGPGGNPGNRPGPGTGSNRPPQPGIPGDRPGPGGNGGHYPGGGLVGNRPDGGSNRPGYGDNLGVGNRPNIGNDVNRPNIGNNVNRPINSGNTNINRPTNNIGNNIGSNNIVNRPTNITNNSITNVSRNNINNITNVNRPGGGYGYGGGYRGGYGGYRPNPYAGYHAGWVNGSWNGNYRRGIGWNTGWGWNNWGLNAMGLGVGIGIASWGMGSLWNTWGYSRFVNPYYMPMTVVQPTTVVVQPVVYDYSRPLDLTSPAPAQSVVEQAVASLDSARAAFQSGDYAQALKLADRAILQTPNDPTLHEFRAMCLFAMARYDEAAVPMFTVLSTGPGWDWTTMIGLYSNVDVYTQQLRALEAYCTANPRAASARFLLAALYMTQGSNDAAAGILQQVVALQPRDTLSAQLLASLTSAAAAEHSQAQGQAAPSQPSAAPTELAAQPAGEPAAPTPPGDENGPAGPALPTDPVPARFLGAWTASPAKDVTISLSLEQDKGFTWKVTDRGESRQFQGQATFDKEVLALAPADQPPMVGTVTWKDNAHFLFKAVGAPANDPGLAFSK